MKLFQSSTISKQKIIINCLAIKTFAQKFLQLPSRHTTLFIQRHRSRIDVEITSCVYWVTIQKKKKKEIAAPQIVTVEIPELTFLLRHNSMLNPF